jgi:YidC/Oxa1 family membrane protein insertase
MMTLKPQLVEIQKKYAKDRQKLAQEQMLYTKSRYYPNGCAVPMIIHPYLTLIPGDYSFWR